MDFLRLKVVWMTYSSGTVDHKPGTDKGSLLTSTIPVVQWAGLHFHPLQIFVLKIWDHTKESLDT